VTIRGLTFPSGWVSKSTIRMPKWIFNAHSTLTG
jgi:hypothetical protein